MLTYFTIIKKQYYLVNSKALKEWVNNLLNKQSPRIVWGGYKKHTLQIQIRLEELAKIGMYIDKRKKPGRKPKNEK